MWMGVAALVILAAAHLTTPAASISFLLAGAVLCPPDKWQTLLRDKLQLSGALKTAVIIVLFLLGVVLTQTSGPENTAAETAAPSAAGEVVLPEEGEEPVSEDQEPPAAERMPDHSPEPDGADTSASPLREDETAVSAEPDPVPAAEPEISTAAENREEEQSAARDYVFNTNSKKFHVPSCSGVGRMNEENKAYFNGTREEALARGYEPCGICKP